MAKAEVYMPGVRSERFSAKLKRSFGHAQAVGRALARTLGMLRQQPSDRRPLPFAQLGHLLPSLHDTPSRQVTYVLGLLLLIRIPFLATGFMQEDALITFRTSFNLADYGSYSFNIGEHSPGATSLLYGLIVASIRLVFQNWAIPVVTSVNVGISILSAFYLSSAYLGRLSSKESGTERWRFMAMWCAVGVSPALLEISVSGMETAFLLLLVGIALDEIAVGRCSVKFVLVVALLPLLRLDAISAGLIILMAAALWRPRASFTGLLALAVGTMIVLLANYGITGQYLPPTALAKEVAYHPDRSLLAVMQRFFHIFFLNTFFLGIESRFIPATVYFVVGIGFLSAILTQLWRISAIALLRVKKRQFELSSVDAARLAMVGYAILPPAAYVYGGVIFPWYLWPSAVVAFALVTGVLIDSYWKRIRLKGVAAAMLSILLLGLSAMRFAVTANAGVQESIYRAGVGRFIASIAHTGDTLFLEPAGYIPFFSGLKTYDEVGLTSPRIVNARRADPDGWWIHFLQTATPTFLVQRSSLSDGRNYWGQQLNNDELNWFSHHYRIIHHFSYVNEIKNAPLPLRIFAEWGSHDDYFVFRYQ